MPLSTPTAASLLVVSSHLAGSHGNNHLLKAATLNISSRYIENTDTWKYWLHLMIICLINKLIGNYWIIIIWKKDKQTYCMVNWKYDQYPLVKIPSAITRVYNNPNDQPTCWLFAVVDPIFVWWSLLPGVSCARDYGRASCRWFRMIHRRQSRMPLCPVLVCICRELLGLSGADFH